MDLTDRTALITGGIAGIASPRASFITGSTPHADGGGTAI
jgi:hypothetical protein